MTESTWGKKVLRDGIKLTKQYILKGCWGHSGYWLSSIILTGGSMWECCQNDREAEKFAQLRDVARTYPSFYFFGQSLPSNSFPSTESPNITEREATLFLFPLPPSPLPPIPHFKWEIYIFFFCNNVTSRLCGEFPSTPPPPIFFTQNAFEAASTTVVNVTGLFIYESLSRYRGTPSSLPQHFSSFFSSWSRCSFSESLPIVASTLISK